MFFNATFLYDNHNFYFTNNLRTNPNSKPNKRFLHSSLIFTVTQKYPLGLIFTLTPIQEDIYPIFNLHKIHYSLTQKRKISLTASLTLIPCSAAMTSNIHRYHSRATLHFLMIFPEHAAYNPCVFVCLPKSQDNFFEVHLHSPYCQLPISFYSDLFQPENIMRFSNMNLISHSHIHHPFFFYRLSLRIKYPKF